MPETFVLVKFPFGSVKYINWLQSPTLKHIVFLNGEYLRTSENSDDCMSKIFTQVLWRIVLLNTV